MTLEHPSIATALRAAGLLYGRLTAKLADAPLFVAWSSLDVLALRPEYAWLSLKDTVCIQLPNTLANITSALHAASRVSKSADYLRLQKPVGQMDSSLRCLANEIASDKERAAARLSEIHRFCIKRWPGWFDTPLHSLKQLLRVGDRPASTALVECLLKHCGRAAVYDCFKQFFHGAGRDIVNQGPGPSRASIDYFLQGHIDMSDVIEVFTEDPWWPGLAKALCDVSSQIDATGAPREDVDAVSPRLESLRESVSRLSETLDALVGGQKVAQESLRLAESELAEVMDIISKISEERESLRRTVEEECAHAEASVH